MAIISVGPIKTEYNFIAFSNANLSALQADVQSYLDILNSNTDVEFSVTMSPVQWDGTEYFVSGQYSSYVQDTEWIPPVTPTP